MRRFIFGLVVVFTLLLVASVASAVPPGFCDDKPDHPQCQDPPPSSTTTTTTTAQLPLAGTMCDPAEYPEGINGVQSDDFHFTLEGKKPGTCIDVLTATAGPWEVTVIGEGARYLGLIPRDSISPGDSCGGPLLRSRADIYGTHTLGYDGSVPAATINACGTEWAEWVDVNLPDLDSRLVSEGGDCAALSDDEEQCLVTDELPVAHPLVLQVFMQSGGGSTSFYVDLPPLHDTWSWPDLP